MLSGRSIPSVVHLALLVKTSGSHLQDVVVVFVLSFFFFFFLSKKEIKYTGLLICKGQLL